MVATKNTKAAAKPAAKPVAKKAATKPATKGGKVAKAALKTVAERRVARKLKVRTRKAVALKKFTARKFTMTGKYRLPHTIRTPKTVFINNVPKT